MSNTALDLRREEQQSIAPTRQDAGNLTPMQMAYQLISNGADLGSVKEMLALSKELAADQAKRAFDAAIASAKSKIGPVSKNKKGHSGRYADFSAYARVVDPILSDHGLSYRFRTRQEDRIIVTCILSHKDGHSEENELSGPADNSGSKNAIQAVGSTLTYLQRYSLVQALGLSASDDDDGQKSGKTEQEVKSASQAQVKKILELVTETDTDIEKFCQWLKVEAITELTEKEAASAITSLEAKKRKLANG